MVWVDTKKDLIFRSFFVDLILCCKASIFRHWDLYKPNQFTILNYHSGSQETGKMST